jgi:hypothetical protein
MKQQASKGHQTSTFRNGYYLQIVVAKSNIGRSCEYHACCGHALTLYVAMRFRLVQGMRRGWEEQAIAIHSVTEKGVDRHRVGFLSLLVGCWW